MNMEVALHTKQSPQKREGEDALIRNAANGIYGVLDGVTPIAAYTDGDGHNGAYLAAQLLKQSMERAEEGTLVTRVARANEELQQAMVAAGIDTSIRHELWAACTAVVHVLDDRIDYAQLGDCMVVSRYADGTIRVWTDNHVQGVSARAKVKRERDRAAGLAVPDEETFQEPLQHMAYNRWLANTPEGYGVANGMADVPQYIQSGTIALEQLTHVMLISDGMFHPELPLEQAMTLLLEEGYDRYVARVEQAEQTKAMRPDDRSFVCLTLQGAAFV